LPLLFAHVFVKIKIKSPSLLLTTKEGREKVCLENLRDEKLFG
jgi:hypothetical protein